MAQTEPTGRALLPSLERAVEAHIQRRAKLPETARKGPKNWLFGQCAIPCTPIYFFYLEQKQRGYGDVDTHIDRSRSRTGARLGVDAVCACRCGDRCLLLDARPRTGRLG